MPARQEGLPNRILPRDLDRETEDPPGIPGALSKVRFPTCLCGKPDAGIHLVSSEVSCAAPTLKHVEARKLANIKNRQCSAARTCFLVLRDKEIRAYS